MKIIRASVEELAAKRLLIGFEGENQRATVRIDCASVFAEYPNATPTLIVKPLFADAYPVVVDRNGTDVDWLITSEILSFSGDGEIQLVFYKDEVICKSAVSKIRVCRSLQVTGTMPDPVAQWIDDANHKLAEVDAQIVELEGMVDTATDAATRAEQSASTASTKAEQAAGSAATATEKATEATNAAGTATAKAAEAEQSALTATEKATAAAESERIATAKAGEATTAAGTATAKAEQATEAAQTATGKAGDASASATAAHASEINAAESADDALAAKTAAEAAKRAAEASATQAAQSAQGASSDAQTAMQKAAEASQSASNAATSEQTATQKAGEAEASAQAASDAKTAVEQTAEQLADSLEQIAQNTQDIAELDERKANVDGYYPDMTVGNAEQLNSSKYVENSEPYTLRTSGGSSDIGNREYLDAVVGGTLAWNQMVRDEASENSTDFAPIVTVDDAVEDAAGVRVKIEPVQDLHGYDHPWPAGGGVNVVDVHCDPFVSAGVTISANNNIININGTKVGGAYKDIPFTLNAGTYYVKAFILGGTVSIEHPDIYIFNGTNNLTGSLYGNETSFTIESNAQLYVRLALWHDNAVYTNYRIGIVVSKTANISSFTPYENLCPISGWTGVQVWDDPVHGGLIEWNQQVTATARQSGSNNGITFTNNEDGSWNVSGTATNDASRIAFTASQAINGHVIYFRGCPTGGGQGVYRLYINGLSGRIDYGDGVIAKPTGLAYPHLTMQVYSGVTVNNVWKPQIFDLTQMFGETKADEIYAMEQAEAGSGVAYFKFLFSADYYPYNAGEITTVSAVNGDPYRHYSFTLPTEAGTVYGGELTVNADGTGSLAVDRAEMVITGEEESIREYRVSPTNFGNYYCSIVFRTFPQTPSKAWDFVSNMLIKTTSSFVGMGVGSGRFQTNNLNFTLCIAGLTTAEEYEAWIKQQATDGHPLTIVHELNTATTFTLTAAQIRTLLGQNHIWSDAGQTALTYTGTDEHLVLESGKKYLSRISGTDSMLLGSGQEITAAKGTDNVFDLTKMFGTAVADYVYGQGAAFFRKWFGEQWYPYNAGELLSVEGLQSHEMVGFNQWDGEYEDGELDDNGNPSPSTSPRKRSKNFIPVLPLTTYYYNQYISIYYYNADKQMIGRIAGFRGPSTFTTPSMCRFIKFIGQIGYNNFDPKAVCISLAHNNSRNGEYEPYEKHSYPLDSSVILRGIPKVGANGVYWDGDRYLPDGTVERRYREIKSSNYACFGPFRNGLGVWVCSFRIDGASANSAKGIAICDTLPSFPDLTYVSLDRDGIVKPLESGFVGILGLTDETSGLSASSTASTVQDTLANYLNARECSFVYELATPITETAQPYHSTQWVSDWGTEEFVSTGLVPVGHETRYPANLRDKLQHLPDAASGNGSYLITQTDGQMVLTPFPAPPSSAGNYVLKATVVNGVATYTWEVAT